MLSFRQFPEQHFIQTVCYDPSGEIAGKPLIYTSETTSSLLVGVGLTSGQVYILDAITLQDVHTGAVFHYSKNSVSHIAFSADSNYMSTAVSIIIKPTDSLVTFDFFQDLDYCITVFKRVPVEGSLRWEFLARYKSHYNDIQGTNHSMF